MSNNRTISDLRMRNEFLRYLASVVQEGKLLPPFDMNPPKGSIKPLERTLPGYEETQSQDDDFMTTLRFLPAKYGGFLLPKPLPAIGAYCYIAASGQVDFIKKDECE